jgi:hypothetical protein
MPGSWGVLLGGRGRATRARTWPLRFLDRAMTIAGGTSEISATSPRSDPGTPRQ